MVFITGYGIGPTSTISGDPHDLNGARSRSAASASPVWKTTSAASFVPDPSGACTRPAHTVRSSEQLATAEAVEVVPDEANPTDRLRDYLRPAEGLSVAQLRVWLLGFRAAHSRFNRTGRRSRDVISGMLAELDQTGRIRVALLPGTLHPK